MNKFGEWVKVNKKEEINEDITPDVATSVNDLHLQGMLKKRVLSLLDELEQANISKSKAVGLLSTIMNQFQTEMNVRPSQQRQAIGTGIDSSSAI